MPSGRCGSYEVMRWYMEKVSEEVERCRVGLIKNSEGEM